MTQTAPAVRPRGCDPWAPEEQRGAMGVLLKSPPNDVWRPAGPSGAWRNGYIVAGQCRRQSACDWRLIGDAPSAPLEQR
jgi:hypothetical protein